MNRTKIETTDWTWNPVTGCLGPGGTPQHPMRCSYCYAERMTGRFPDRDFNPTFHPERLEEPRKVKHSVKIFVCSMADLLGDWVPDEWIEAVLNRTQMADYRHHTYQFLTKNPKRLAQYNPWPDNCWVGTTITDQEDADSRLSYLLAVKARVLFVSHEPLLGQIDMSPGLLRVHGDGTPWFSYRQGIQPHIQWGIIGAMTGAKAVAPPPMAATDLYLQYQAARTPVFLKSNLKWPEKIQEWPVGDAG